MIKSFLVVIAYLLLAYNLNAKEESSALSVASSSSSVQASSKVRENVIDALIEQVMNDPLVHLKYWYWGGHSPDDLEDYIWMNYHGTHWRVTHQEARVLKNRAIKRLDVIYRKKAEKKFGKSISDSVRKKK